MKTSNPFLCNIPYFNNFNYYCFFFLIKSLETETLERGQNSGVWSCGGWEEMLVHQNQYSEPAKKHLEFSSVRFIVSTVDKPGASDVARESFNLLEIQLVSPRLYSDNSINCITISSW